MSMSPNALDNQLSYRPKSHVTGQDVAFLPIPIALRIGSLSQLPLCSPYMRRIFASNVAQDTISFPMCL